MAIQHKWIYKLSLDEEINYFNDFCEVKYKLIEYISENNGHDVKIRLDYLTHEEYRKELEE